MKPESSQRAISIQCARWSGVNTHGTGTHKPDTAPLQHARSPWPYHSSGTCHPRKEAEARLHQEVACLWACSLSCPSSWWSSTIGTVKREGARCRIACPPQEKTHGLEQRHDLFARALFESHDWISRIMQDKWFLLPANQTGASRHLAQAPPAISLFLLLPAGKESYLFPFPLSKLRLRQLQLFHALSHI